MNRAAGVLLGTCLMSALSYAGTLTLATSSAGLGTNDTVDWSSIGPDATALLNAFSAVSAGADTVSGAFSTTVGQIANVGVSWGPATGVFTDNQALVWAYDGGSANGTGPVSLSSANALSGIGVGIQADSPGQFTAQIQLFNGVTSLGSFTEQSNANGDAIFIGATDSVAEITGATFSLTAGTNINNESNYLGDFAIGTASLVESTTPEPASFFLMGGALSLLGMILRRRHSRRV